jgi:hypothetical protein
VIFNYIITSFDIFNLIFKFGLILYEVLYFIFIIFLCFDRFIVLYIFIDFLIIIIYYNAFIKMFLTCQLQLLT